MTLGRPSSAASDDQDMRSVAHRSMPAIIDLLDLPGRQRISLEPAVLSGLPALLWADTVGRMISARAGVAEPPAVAALRAASIDLGDCDE